MKNDGKKKGKTGPNAALRKLTDLAGKVHRKRTEGAGRQVWAFNGGETFSGNPKWLFIYVNRYRPDIEAYWICESRETVMQVRELGFLAESWTTLRGRMLQAATRVYCVDQVKEKIPALMSADMIMLNLYHGVGCKTVEKKIRYGFLQERIANKYILHNDFYLTRMLFLVTSPLMEEHFLGQIGLTKANLVRGGYPRCLYQRQYERVETFRHDILRQKGLPADTKVALYVPTYRDDPDYDFWAEALPDMPRLLEKLEASGALLIIKLHPQMLSDPAYAAVREQYKEEKRLLFWDPRQDIYEIFDKIDIAIVDYSSIFYDLLAAGVPYFIRYFYDYDRREENLRDFVFDLEEMTCGAMCTCFDALLDALGETADPAGSEEGRRRELMRLFWSYADEDSLDRIVDAAKRFRPLPLKLPVLYSFSVSGARAQAGRLEELVKEREKVILICENTRLPAEVRKELMQAAPCAASLPLFQVDPQLMQEGGMRMKAEVFRQMEDYPYRAWVHAG